MRSIPLALAALLLPCALAAQNFETITPSITLIRHADPIDDTDHSSVMVSSEDGVPLLTGLEVDWECEGPRVTVGLYFPAPVAGWSRVIWRFGVTAPDTLPLEPGRPMRVYGGPDVWMVIDKPPRYVDIPDSLQAAFTRRARGAERLVVRLEGERGQRDWYFDLRGLSDALGELSCVTRPAPPAAAQPRVLRQFAGPVYYDAPWLDVPPLPADSAAVAAALAREIPVEPLRNLPLRNLPVGDLTGYLDISAEGVVDSVVVISMNRDLDAAATRFFRAIRFTPGQQDGKPVPSRVTLDVQARDPYEELRMP
ncbi:MAG TPA: energy transducer TonB [Longimicrobium sp.]|nr:energy transducer TonB [Longimicrobium sp.]